MTNLSPLVELDLSGSNRLACRCSSTLMWFAPDRQYVTCASCGAVVLTIRETNYDEYNSRTMRVLTNLHRKHGQPWVQPKTQERD